MAFPWGIAVLDNFNRANSPNLGANWTPVGAFVNPITIETNAARGSAGNFCAEVWVPANFGPDCACYDTFSLYSSGQFEYLILRSDGNNNEYELVISAGPPATWQIYKRDSGGATALGSSATQAISNGDLWGFDAIGTTLTGYYSNNGGSSWSQIVQTTDSTYTGAGAAGFGTESNGSIFEDFAAGTVASTPPPLILPQPHAVFGPF